MEAPRKVEKVSVKYDRVSKQVDVRALKHIIWDGISNRSQAGVAGDLPSLSSFRNLACAHLAFLSVALRSASPTVSAPVPLRPSRAEVDFMDVLQGIPELSAAGQAEDLSVHLCFICALHLCNEHSLSLSDGREAGVPDLSTLRISDIPHA